MIHSNVQTRIPSSALTLSSKENVNDYLIKMWCDSNNKIGSESQILDTTKK